MKSGKRILSCLLATLMLACVLLAAVACGETTETPAGNEAGGTSGGTTAEVETKSPYDELEKEGFLYTVPGKGCFVAPRNLELLREENLKKIESHMEQIAVLAASCNLTKEDLKAMLDFCMEGKA